MSDASLPATPNTPDLSQQIMDAPEPLWRKISELLKVRTREEAIQLVESDANVASVVQQIIQGALAGKTALTQGSSTSSPTALTSAPIYIPPAQTLYGGGRAKVKF